MSNALDILAKHILKWEGGLFVSPTEGGGAANKGVTFETYQDNALALLGKQPTYNNFLALTDSEAKKFVVAYANQIKYQQINSNAIGVLLTEIAWGSGIKQAGYSVQNVLNKNFGYQLKVDGVIGKNTLAAINATPASTLYDLLISYRKQWLINLIARKPSLDKFKNGWFNRVNAMLDLKPQLLKKAAITGGTILAALAAFYISKKVLNGN